MTTFKQRINDDMKEQLKEDLKPKIRQKGKKEFNLSDKRVMKRGKISPYNNQRYYLEDDVKEFIRLLKEKSMDFTSTITFHELIDEFAGEKLK